MSGKFHDWVTERCQKKWGRLAPQEPLREQTKLTRVAAKITN